MKLPVLTNDCHWCQGRPEFGVRDVTVLVSSFGSPVSFLFPCRLCGRWNDKRASIPVLVILLPLIGWVVADAATYAVHNGDPVESGLGLRDDDAQIDEAAAAMAASIDTTLRELLTPRGAATDPDHSRKDPRR